MDDRRLLLVHAHPDDESISTGATMAHYASSGAQVSLLTCTLGEQGEIIVAEYRRLEAAQADQLGGLRIGELAAAMDALGVTDHRFLGGAGRFRDSGMMGTPANDHPRAFWRAATQPEVFDEAVAEAVAVIREVRPQVLVTYDDNGDYGHPDHIMAHRVAMAAVDRAADPDHRPGAPWTVAKLYWTATPTSVLRADSETLSALADPPLAAADLDEVHFGVADEVITTVIDAPASRAAKTAALQAHRTQVVVVGDFFALSNTIGRTLRSTEYFRLVRGRLGAQRDAAGHETDLFAGVGG